MQPLPPRRPLLTRSILIEINKEINHIFRLLELISDPLIYDSKIMREIELQLSQLENHVVDDSNIPLKRTVLSPVIQYLRDLAETMKQRMDPANETPSLLTQKNPVQYFTDHQKNLDVLLMSAEIEALTDSNPGLDRETVTATVALSRTLHLGSSKYQ